MHYTRSFISPAWRGSQTLSLAILFCLLLLLLRAPSFSVKFMQYLFFYAPPSSPPYPSLTWGPASPLFLPFFAPLGPSSLNLESSTLTHTYHKINFPLSPFPCYLERWDIFSHSSFSLFPLTLARFPRADISDSETGKGERARFRGQRGLKVRRPKLRPKVVPRIDLARRFQDGCRSSLPSDWL